MTNETGPPGGVELVPQGPLLRWLPRLLLLMALALMATHLVDLASAVRTAGSIAPRQAIVAAIAVLYTVPTAVLAWRSTSKLCPRSHTVQEISWSITASERRAVGRALRRGEPIAAEHQAWAIATTTAARRAYGWFPTIAIWTWGSAIDESVREHGSGFFWFQAGTAAISSVAFCSVIVLQLRCERSVRALRS